MDRPLSLLCVGPGASYATADVANGFNAALVAQGYRVREYRLDERIDDANSYYRFVYRKRKLGTPPPALVLTKAGSDIVSQALYHAVDGVIIYSAMYLAPDYLALLRRAGIPTALVLSESPYDDAQQAKILPVVDVAFTNERASLPYLRRFNPNTHYMGHAYDPTISRPHVFAGTAPAHDVLFIGSLFEERINLLAGVAWDGIDLGIYGGHELLPSRHRLRKFVRGKVIPNRLAQSYYRAAKIVLNPYRTSRGFGVGVEHITHAESLNPRALEAAACGVFHISEHRAEVAEVFGDLVPTYAANDSHSLETTVRYFLEHEEERRAKAKALPAAVRGHTYAARAAEMMAHIAAAWSSRGRRGALSA